MEQTHRQTHDPRAFAAPAGLDRLRRRVLLAGGAGTALVLVGAFLDPTQFYRSYLIAFVLWLGVGLGSLGLNMLHHLTGGRWGLPVRRLFEAAGRTLPLLALLFVPIVIGLGHLYSWADPQLVAHDALLQKKAAYLNANAFVARTAIYFVIWIGMALQLGRWSAAQDRSRDPDLVRRLRWLSAPGLVLFCLTTTFAGFDWLMSLQPDWFSSIYGVYFIGSVALAALAFTIVAAALLARRQPFTRYLTPASFNDYGNLLLAFVMLWAYFSVSQLIIVWSGNLPEETVWYLARVGGGWEHVALLIGLFHFALPFLLLLSRSIKRNARRLAGVAVGVLVMRWVDLVWQAVPAFHPGALHLHWLDAVTPLAMGAIWIWFFLGRLRGRPLLPVGAPDLQEVLAHE